MPYQKAGLEPDQDNTGFLHASCEPGSHLKLTAYVRKTTLSWQKTTRLPACSARFKQRTGGVVYSWVNTCKYLLSYGFACLYVTVDSNDGWASPWRLWHQGVFFWGGGLPTDCSPYNTLFLTLLKGVHFKQAELVIHEKQKGWSNPTKRSVVIFVRTNHVKGHCVEQ